MQSWYSFVFSDPQLTSPWTSLILNVLLSQTRRPKWSKRCILMCTGALYSFGCLNVRSWSLISVLVGRRMMMKTKKLNSSIYCTVWFLFCCNQSGVMETTAPLSLIVGELSAADATQTGRAVFYIMSPVFKHSQMHWWWRQVVYKGEGTGSCPSFHKRQRLEICICVGEC